MSASGRRRTACGKGASETCKALTSPQAIAHDPRSVSSARHTASLLEMIILKHFIAYFVTGCLSRWISASDPIAVERRPARDMRGLLDLFNCGSDRTANAGVS
jgi:hypothetical protein